LQQCRPKITAGSFPPPLPKEKGKAAAAITDRAGNPPPLPKEKGKAAAATITQSRRQPKGRSSGNWSG